MISLYRKGDAHIVRGVKCERKVFHVDELEMRLDEGWVKSPTDPLGEAHTTKLKENQMIREAAKRSGIESWETARIATLKAELEDAES